MKLTVNDMIFKTINTKISQEPRYKEVLEQMGYVVYNSEWSTYEKWTVKNPSTGRMVCFSKGYDNKRRLYDGFGSIKGNIKKVNLVGYLNCTRKHEDTQSPYKELRIRIRGAKRDIREEHERIADIQREIDQLKEEMDRRLEKLAGYEETLRDARERVAELRKEA